MTEGERIAVEHIAWLIGQGLSDSMIAFIAECALSDLCIAPPGVDEGW